MNAKIYTILVTYNGIEWIERSLKSLIDSSLKTNIVVVDNLSTDGTVSLIEQVFPEITILQQQENLGFGKANNIGISYALKNKADYVFLLNQDAWMAPDVFEKLISISVKNKSFGVLSPTHYVWDGSEFEYYFFRFASKNYRFLEDTCLTESDSLLYEVSFVNAAAWLIPRRVLESIGGFDPMFKHYGEDNNYCQRLKHHGFKIGIVSNCTIYHDSKIRTEPPNYLFSEAYFNNEIKNLQIEYGDLNRNFTRKDIRSIRIHNIKLMLRNLLKLKLRRAVGYCKKYMIFEKEFRRIRNSRKMNQVIGSHYLES